MREIESAKRSRRKRCPAWERAHAIENFLHGGRQRDPHVDGLEPESLGIACEKKNPDGGGSGCGCHEWKLSLLGRRGNRPENTRSLLSERPVLAILPISTFDRFPLGLSFVRDQRP